MLTAPVTFSAGNRYLERKVNLPTELSSLDIAEKMPSLIRGWAFFSAKVATAHILEALREEVEKYFNGEVNLAEARGNLRTFLARQGVGIPPPDSADDKDLGNLGSTARLNLILTQNAAMASAVAHREVAEDPAVMDILPNYEYVKNTDRHAKFDGVILPKTDPFWRTHFPPIDFRCQCFVIDTDDAPTAKSSKAGDKVEINGKLLDAAAPQSGYQFDSTPANAFREPDFNAINDSDLRATAKRLWAASPWAKKSNKKSAEKND